MVATMVRGSHLQSQLRHDWSARVNQFGNEIDIMEIAPKDFTFQSARNVQSDYLIEGHTERMLPQNQNTKSPTKQPTTKPSTPTLVPTSTLTPVSARPSAAIVACPSPSPSPSYISLRSGGDIMRNTPNVYVIFYGDWQSSVTFGSYSFNHASEKTVILDFLGSLSGSSWLDILRDYYTMNGATKIYSTGEFILQSSVTVGYTRGKSLSQNNIWDLVQDQLTTGTFPSDQNGLYFVLTAADVKVGSLSSSFCTSYCGWHSWTNNNLKYSFVGNPSILCPKSCPTQLPGPNGVGNAGMYVHFKLIVHLLFKFSFFRSI